MVEVTRGVVKWKARGRAHHRGVGSFCKGSDKDMIEGPGKSLRAHPCGGLQKGG